MTVATERKKWHWWQPVVWLLLLLLAGTFATIAWNPFLLIEGGLNVQLFFSGVQQKFVDVDGYRIAYLEKKPTGNGPDKPIVLIHGLGGRATNWTGLMPELVRQGYHVYALDLLGYGDSPKTLNLDFSLANEEKVAVGFMKALHIQNADVGGWSMGGWVAMKLALDDPELVRRLLVYDTAGLYFKMNFPISLFAPHDRASMDELYRHIEPNRPHIVIPAFAVPGMLRRFRLSQPYVDASFRSMLTGSELLDFRVPQLKMPMLIVWGTEDNLTPMTMGLRLHALVPQSHFVGIKGCGHLAAAECVDQVLPATVKFLNAEPAPVGGEETLDSGWH